MWNLFFLVITIVIFHILFLQDDWEYNENVGQSAESTPTPTQNTLFGIDVSYTGSYPTMRANREFSKGDALAECIDSDLFDRCGIPEAKANVGRNEIPNPKNANATILSNFYALSDIKKGDAVYVVNAMERLVTADDGRKSEKKIISKTHISDGDEIIYISA